MAKTANCEAVKLKEAHGLKLAAKQQQLKKPLSSVA